MVTPFASTGLHKVSVHVTPDLLSIVQVVGDTQIYEVDNGASPVSINYQLPENMTEIVDFRTNSDLLIVQTQDYFYIYRRYINQLNNMLATFQSGNSRFLISPRSPNAICVNTQHSIAYVASEGFFVARNSQGLNHTVTITATSTSYDGSNPQTCDVDFLITSVTDDTAIYTKANF